jgi:hypothetical protein
MPAQAKNGYMEPPRTRRELRVLYNRVIRKVTSMSSRKRVDSLVRAGIITKQHKLAKPYKACAQT